MVANTFLFRFRGATTSIVNNLGLATGCRQASHTVIIPPPPNVAEERTSAVIDSRRNASR